MKSTVFSPPARRRQPTADDVVAMLVDVVRKLTHPDAQVKMEGHAIARKSLEIVERYYWGWP
jgi:hypothetical protein